MFGYFRRAAGDVHGLRFVFRNPITNAPSRRLIEHLGAPRRGIHVAMTAGLITLAADIELQRDERLPSQLQIVPGEFFLKSIHRGKYKGWTLKGNAIIIRR